MRPPCEIVQKELLPTIRSKLAQALHNRGLSQNQIAENLEITQAAVSKYLGQPVETVFANHILDSLIETLVTHIVAEDLPRSELVKQLCSVCMSLRIAGPLCNRHRELVSSLEVANCRICADLLGGEPLLRKKVSVLSDMDSAIKIIENTSSFVKLLPQVRASLVACDDSAETYEQVAGIPGRITDIGGRARAPAPPEFGASKHTASLLLKTKKIVPFAKACLCISAHPVILKNAELIGFETISISTATADTDQIIKEARPGLNSFGSRIDKFAIHVPGGVGIEPVLYLFGKTATELAMAGKKLSELLE